MDSNMEKIVEDYETKFKQELEDISKELEQQDFQYIEHLIEKFDYQVDKVIIHLQQNFIRTTSMAGGLNFAEKVWKNFYLQIIDKEKSKNCRRLIIHNCLIFYSNLMSLEKGIDEERFQFAHTKAKSKSILRFNLYLNSVGGRGGKILNRKEIEEMLHLEIEESYIDFKFIFDERKADAERDMAIYMKESLSNYTKKFNSSNHPDDNMKHAAAIEAALQLFAANTKVLGLKLGDFQIGRDDLIYEQRLREEMEEKYKEFKKSQRCCCIF